MDNFTTNNYEMKREIINFSKKISDSSDKPESKFIMDMIYGISKSKDILLSSIAGALDEKTKKAYVIDRLSDNLSNDLSSSIDENNVSRRRKRMYDKCNKGTNNSRKEMDKFNICIWNFRNTNDDCK